MVDLNFYKKLVKHIDNEYEGNVAVLAKNYPFHKLLPRITLFSNLYSLKYNIKINICNKNCIKSNFNILPKEDLWYVFSQIENYVLIKHNDKLKLISGNCHVKNLVFMPLLDMIDLLEIQL